MLNKGKIMNRKLDFYLCDCGAEAIAIEYDEELREIAIELWMGGYRRNPFKWRLKCIKQIIKEGHPFWDCVYLNIEKAKEVRNKLDEYIKLIEKQDEQ